MRKATPQPPPSGSDGYADDRDAAIFDRQIENVGEARAWISGFLESRGGDASLREDAVLVVSELVTNALRYGIGNVVLRAVFGTDGLSVSVTDSGDSLPRALPVDSERIGGLGLHIVERLANAWGVSRFPGGKTVWAVLDGHRR